MKTQEQNTIDRTIIIKAPLEKVWRAMATAEGFSSWFCKSVEGDWSVGEKVILRWPSGNGTEIVIAEIDPPKKFAYKWHPGAYDKISDHPESQLTTVACEFNSVEGGTELHLVESGFENIPEDRRLNVLGMNSQGWDEELENMRKSVEA